MVAPNESPLASVRGKYARFLPRNKLTGCSIVVVRTLRVRVAPVQVRAARLKKS